MASPALEEPSLVLLPVDLTTPWFTPTFRDPSRMQSDPDSTRTTAVACIVRTLISACSVTLRSPRRQCEFNARWPLRREKQRSTGLPRGVERLPLARAAQDRRVVSSVCQGGRVLRGMLRIAMIGTAPNSVQHGFIDVDVVVVLTPCSDGEDSIAMLRPPHRQFGAIPE
jgi:hypothetical protein